MKHTGVKLLCLLLAMVLLVGFAGCGADKDGDTDGSAVTTTTTATQGGEEQHGFYDENGNFYAYFDEDNDYVWDGFTDAEGNTFYFFDENEDGTPDGYTDAEGNRFYYDGSSDGGETDATGTPIVPVATTTTTKGEVVTTTKGGDTVTTTASTKGNATTVVTTTTKVDGPTQKPVVTTTKVNGPVTTTVKDTPAATTTTIATTTTTTGGAQQLTSKELYKAVRGTTVHLQYRGEISALEKKQITAFERAYGCKVETSIMAWNDFKNQFLAMVASGNVPDNVGIPDETYLKWVTKGLLQPLDDYVVADDELWADEIWDRFSWKGEHYGVGGQNGIVPMFCIYNASLFKAKGVKTPLEYYEENNWTFETFKKAAIEMTYGDVIGSSLSWRYLLHLCNGNTAVNVDADNGKVTNALTEKSAITATELIVELKRGGYTTFEAPFDLFGNAQIAMVLERPWNIIGQFDLRNTTLKNAEIEMAPLPKGPDAKEEYSVNIMNANGVPTKAKNPLGACAWYYFGIQYSNAHANDADVVENRRKTYTDEQYKFQQDYLKNHKSINTFVYGVGNWYSDDWGYWASMILDGLSVQAANAKFAGEFQTMINTLGNS